MKKENIQLAIKVLNQSLLDVETIIMRRVDSDKIRPRLGENIATINSPISITLEFFILDFKSEEDKGVCLSVSFQNHEPVVNGLQNRKANELFAYADLSYVVGECISNFGILRLGTDAMDFNQKLEECLACMDLYFKSQIPIIVDKLNE